MADKRKREASAETDTAKGRKFHSYTLEFKLEAVNHVKMGNSKEATARKFGVAPKRIREWCKQEDKLHSQSDHSSQGKRKRLEGGGRRPLSETLETELYAWIELQRFKRLRVTRKKVKREALSIFSQNNGYAEDANKDFVASDGWLRNFFRRHQITLRRKTTVSQKVPDVLAPKLLSYFLYVRSLRLKKQYSLDQIIAMDETPVWLDMPGETTVDFVGNKSIPLKSTGHEKMRVTVVLSAKANGTKLPPFIVFKGKRYNKELDKIPGIVCAFSENGWMNENLTHTWLNKVYGTLCFSRRLLVWDAYKCHIQDSTKRLLSKLKTDVAVIPGGCTGLVQAPDVCWNKPFKSHYARLYEDWMCEDQHSYTKGGNVKPATKFQLASWVKAAWDQIPTELIKKSFIVCGISNALDNSEDERINVLKPDGILQSSREDVLNKLKKVTEAQGNMNNISNPPTSEEDEDANSENELAVEYDDDFDDEDDVPLSECLV